MRLLQRIFELKNCPWMSVRLLQHISEPRTVSECLRGCGSAFLIRKYPWVSERLLWRIFELENVAECLWGSIDMFLNRKSFYGAWEQTDELKLGAECLRGVWAGLSITKCCWVSVRLPRHSPEQKIILGCMRANCWIKKCSWVYESLIQRVFELRNHSRVSQGQKAKCEVSGPVQTLISSAPVT